MSRWVEIDYNISFCYIVHNFPLAAGEKYNKKKAEEKWGLLDESAKAKFRFDSSEGSAEPPQKKLKDETQDASGGSKCDEGLSGGLPLACSSGVLEALPAKDSIESLQEFHKKYKRLKQKLRSKKATRVAECQRSNSERWPMYVDIAKLVQVGVFSSPLEAEKNLSPYAVNRKKVGVVIRLLERGGDTEAPALSV